MKKTKVKKKKTPVSRKPKKTNIFVSFIKENKLLAFLIILLIFFTLFFVFYNFLNVTGNVGKGDGTVQSLENLLDQPIDFGKIIFAFLNGVGSNGFTEAADWKDLTVMIIVFAIILVAIYDILSLLALFYNDWVNWTIAIGLAIIAALTGFIRQAATFLFQTGAGLFAFATGLEIVVVAILFIGLIFGSTWIAKFAAKRKGQREYIRSIGGSHSAGAAIRGLRALDREFRA
jgi:hypothetical protein